MRPKLCVHNPPSAAWRGFSAFTSILALAFLSHQEEKWGWWNWDQDFWNTWGVGFLVWNHCSRTSGNWRCSRCFSRTALAFLSHFFWNKAPTDNWGMQADVWHYCKSAKFHSISRWKLWRLTLSATASAAKDVRSNATHSLFISLIWKTSVHLILS